jgi:hypothetical protein
VSPVELALARRLAQHPRFRWMPGMRVWRPNGNGWHVTYVTPVELWSGDSYDPINGSHVPDLSDPATQGWLLSMLRDAINDGLTTMEIWMEPTDGKKSVIVTIKPLGETPHGPWASTLGEALARALLAAWGEPSGSAG